MTMSLEYIRAKKPYADEVNQGVVGGVTTWTCAYVWNTWQNV